MKKKQKSFRNASFVGQPKYNCNGDVLMADRWAPPKFILTSDPAGPTLVDFLIMVYEWRTPVVVMLCQ